MQNHRDSDRERSDGGSASRNIANHMAINREVGKGRSTN